MSVGKVPEILVGAAPSANSNHDNPVSGNHQAPSHRAKNSVERNHQAYPYLPRGMGGTGTKAIDVPASKR